MSQSTLFLNVKPGVVFKLLRQEIWRSFPIIARTWLKFAPEVIPTITSAADGNHPSNSLHWLGLAIDLRRWGIPPKKISPLISTLRKKLGPAYDVVLEETHIHLQYDPAKAVRHKP